VNYLFVGEDEFSKDTKLEKIKDQLNLAKLEAFNFEILYAGDLDLSTLKERLSLLPINPALSPPLHAGAGLAHKGGVNARQRLILIKDAPKLSADIKQYLVSWLSQPFPHVSLILDARRVDERDQFFNQISGLVKVINFRRSVEINAFTLARSIGQKKIKPALRLLHQLLLQGSKPEIIIGALRYQLAKERLDFAEQKKKLKFLFDCDIDIKTGRLKPEFALERLLIRLCS